MQYKVIFFDAYDTLVEITQKENPYKLVLDKAPDKTAIRLAILQSDLTLQALCKKENINLSKKAFPEIENKIQREIHSIRLFDDVIPTLACLVKKNIKIGIISNLSQPYGAPLIKLLDQYVDKFVFSFKEGCVKPNNEIFNLALKQFNCKPQEALMIGNNIKSDVEGAKTIGINAILLVRHNKKQAQDSIQSIKEIKTRLTS